MKPQAILQKIIDFMANNKKAVKIFSALFVVFLIVYSVVSSLFSPPKILTSTPSNESKQIGVSDPITITTDKNVNEKDFFITSKPENTFVIAKSGDKTYTFTPSPSLHTNTKYTVFIQYKRKNILGIQFETLQQQSDPTLLEQASIWMKENYPLASFLPIKTKEYELYYLKEKTLAIAKYLPTLSDEDAKKIAEQFLLDHNMNDSTQTIVVVDGTKFAPIYSISTSN